MPPFFALFSVSVFFVEILCSLQFSDFIQETYQELSDRTKLHVLEMRPENENFPRVIASPSDGVVSKEPLRLNPTEEYEQNFQRYYYGGRVYWNRPKGLPIYHKFEAYKMALKRRAKEGRLRKGNILRKAKLWNL